MNTQNQIALKYRKAIVLDTDKNSVYQPRAITLAIEMLQLGFVASKDLLGALSGLESTEIGTVAEELISELRALKGDNVKHSPMYPNFPEQVAEASDIELFLNAILHYWTLGHWMPEYEALPREFADEKIKLIEIGVVDSDDFRDILGELLSSNESLSDGDKATVVWFIDNDWPATFVMLSDYKENMCFVAGELLKRGMDITGIAQTATDVLRIVTALNDGDVSLASNTKFKSLPRKLRRLLVGALDKVATEEDINRFRGKWAVLFHNLHVGEYSQRLYDLAKKVRENEKIATFNSKVQAALDSGNYKLLIGLLETRPGELARRLDVVLRKFAENDNITTRIFKQVVPQINTRVLLQVYGHMKTRFNNTERRIAFPKGNVQHALLLDGQEALNNLTVEKILATIKTELITRFSACGEENLGDVWIDPALADCPIPTQMRSASEGLFQVARGTRFTFGDEEKTTLRFFVYWKGQDIDLSATMHDENFKYINHISYTHLRDGNIKSYHSGDITRAPKGASEFIDIDIDAALAAGVRYVAMELYVFSGPTFAEHEICFAGWMTRSKPKSNEIFDPKTVEQKIDLRQESKNAVPVIFDLQERKAIWADMNHRMNDGGGSYFGGNNVENNRASTEQVTEALLNIDNKVSLYELFTFHAAARGDHADSPESADTIFSWSKDYEDARSEPALERRNVTPYDISVINSEFIK